MRGRDPRSSPVEISPALAADLAFLTIALDEPDSLPLGSVLQRLVDDVRLAVPSFLGFTMALMVDGEAVTFTAVQGLADPGRAVTSARVPLEALTDFSTGGRIAFYATQPGAFVDFAADVTFALGLHPHEVVLDADLDKPAATPRAPRPGLADTCQINQAIGILIDHGFLPGEAEQEIRDRATAQQVTYRAAAGRLIDSATLGIGVEVDPRRRDE